MNDLAGMTLADVEAARELLQGVSRAPRSRARGRCPRRSAGPVHLKCENLQRAGLVQDPGGVQPDRPALARGARCEASSRRAPATTRKGWRSRPRSSGIRTTVFMPEGATLPKVPATRALRRRRASRRVTPSTTASTPRAAFAAETGAVLIHPFDHADIVAGQGTVGLEILEQCPDVAHDRGLHWAAAGCSPGSRWRSSRSRPDVRVDRRAGREGGGLPAVAGRRAAAVRSPSMATMADGIAVGPSGRRAVRDRRRPRRRRPYRLRGVAVARPAALPRAGQAGRRAGRGGRRRRRSWTTRRPSSRPSSPSSPAATSTRCCCCG